MKTIDVALVGAPNCGKTVLFNALTRARGKVANYPGVTVDKKVGAVPGHNINIIDLPGTYGLRVTSLDEQVTRDVLLGKLGERPDVILAVVDETNLRMSLRMLLELKELGLPIIASLNLSDLAQKRGLKLDLDKLRNILGFPIVETVAISEKGRQAIKHEVTQLTSFDFLAQQTNEIVTDEMIDNIDSDKLYQQVDEIMQEVVISSATLPYWHRKADELILHPVSGFMILLAVLLFTFQAVYSWSAPLMDMLENGTAEFGIMVGNIIPPGMVHSLVVDGIIAGVGSVLVFLPQIVILFLLILLLEDSGYLPRAAFLLDHLFYKIGLSGRTFIPLLSSFACAVPSIMSARTISNPRERMVTIAIAPLMTCSARLPVYALLIAAVIPDKTVWGLFNLQGLTLFALYMIAIISAVIVAWVMKIFATRKGKISQFPLLMELPTYRIPNFRHIMVSLWERTWAFIRRAGTIIFALSIILWGLVTFPGAPANATMPAIDYSFAGMLGHIIEPIFAPLGFSWQICIAMIPGIAAREVVVAALGTVYAVGVSESMAEQTLIPIIHESWGLATAFAFLTWYIFAPMCMATLAVIKRETKSMKATLLITGYLTALAYIGALIVYQITLGVIS